jgi:poly(hydroxyalkanoate) depolymerase family esterase
MRSISDTIERLARNRARPFGAGPDFTSLLKLRAIGRNPGELTGWYQVRKTGEDPLALVVVLHGCTQTAAGYDQGSGWSKLAADYGFAVLFPEQSHGNNANLCFNWFQPEDISRGKGEVQSVREMIGSMITDHNVDPKRIFVTGLSAGGAMANALLATYPDVFAGGAIIAGLPYGVASTVPEAFDRMRGHGFPATAALDAKLRAASAHQGPWPTITVWHGTADNTVAAENARLIVDQWRGVHMVGSRPTSSEPVDGHVREAWKDDYGRDVIELYSIKGMGHGTPVETATGYGRSAPYMLDVGISSTVHIARNWGLTPSFQRRADSAETADAKHENPSKPKALQRGIQDVIENALRSAGLMK